LVEFGDVVLGCFINVDIGVKDIFGVFKKMKGRK
jgi:hypothetical protein